MLLTIPLMPPINNGRLPRSSTLNTAKPVIRNCKKDRTITFYALRSILLIKLHTITLNSPIKIDTFAASDAAENPAVYRRQA